MITVETRFATGNGQVTNLGDGELVIDRDLRDSTGDRWYWIVLTARHHACEAVASFVLEGAVRQFVADLQNRRPPAPGCELIVVPMVDIDGVVAGDQGKARQPWDHNRDYGAVSRYVAVRALRDLLARDRRPLLALDFHTPGLRGPLEERSYVVASGDADDAEKAQQLLDALPADPAHGANTAALLVFDPDRARSFGAAILRALLSLL